MAKKAKRLSIQIPFSGFYESRWSQALDYEVEREGENYEERQREADSDDWQPQETRLEASDFAEAINNAMNWRSAFAAVASDYSECFDTWASGELRKHFDLRKSFALKLKFEELDSPKYYNYGTDRIFCTIPQSVAVKLFGLSLSDGHQTLAALIAERFTSRPGFLSSYDNTLSAWLDKPVIEWDHNELKTLLDAVMKIAGFDEKEVEESIEQGIAESGDGFAHYIDGHCDWPGYEAAIQEKRDELRAELEPDWAATQPAPRCRNTLDMFARAAA